MLRFSILVLRDDSGALKIRWRRCRNLSTIKAKISNQYFCSCENKISPHLHWNGLQAKQRLSLGSGFGCAPRVKHSVDWKPRVSHHRALWKEDDSGLENRCSKLSKQVFQDIKKKPENRSIYIELHSCVAHFLG